MLARISAPWLPTLPKPCRVKRLALQRLAAVGVVVLDAVGDALAGGLHAALGAADAHVLAGDDAAHVVALALAVRVLAAASAP